MSSKPLLKTSLTSFIAQICRLRGNFFKGHEFQPNFWEKGSPYAFGIHTKRILSERLEGRVVLHLKPTMTLPESEDGDGDRSSRGETSVFGSSGKQVESWNDKISCTCVQGDPCCDFHTGGSLCLHVTHPRQDPYAGTTLILIILVQKISILTMGKV